MIYKILSSKNIDIYIDYLRQAIKEEPEMMTTDIVDEDGLKERIKDNFFNNSTSILAVQEGRVIGRIEYHFYGCIQDGYKMAYVNWVYVLKDYRKQGVARSLFKEFEKDCIAKEIDEYFLIRANNEAAEKFYNSFSGAKSSSQKILRKSIK